MILKIYLSNIFPIAIKIVGGLLLVRTFADYLGKEGLGLVSQYQSVMTLGYGVFTALIFNFTVKNKWKKTEFSDDFHQLLAWIIKIGMFAGLGFALMSIPLSYLMFDSPEYASFLLIAGLQLPLIAIYVALSARMCANGNQVSYNTIIGFSTAIAFIGIWIGTRNFNITGAFIALAAFYIPAFLIHGYIGRSELAASVNILRGKTLNYSSLPLLKFSMVAITSAFLAVAIQIVVRNYIYNTSNCGIVGDWQTITKISESYLLLASIPLATFFLPKYSAQTSANGRLNLLIKISWLSLLIVLITGTSIFLLWNEIVVLVIGVQFQELKYLFGLQVIGDCFKILTWVLVTAAMGDNRINLVLYIEIFFAVFYCGLVYLIFPSYGMRGAIASYGLAYLSTTILMLMSYKKFYGK
jgi:O-antigen/teichoic acid export membrane protein